MTDKITAALDALDKATPGPWVAELCLGGAYVIDNTLPENKGKVRHIAEVWGPLATPANAALIAAAPDLAAEVIRLRKWQSEAMKLIDGCLAMPSELADRLIAEAKGE